MTEVIGAVGPFQIVWHLVLGLSIVIHAWQMFANKWLTYKVQGYSDCNNVGNGSGKNDSGLLGYCGSILARAKGVAIEIEMYTG